jgi:coenzyme Q-binding protein COQ10|tara:strand:+ start:396 stop:851 length:456 start_codon:yes stop_codon:yes gene_type:complete
MQNISLQRISPYGARQMFDLVADVDRYSEFIPYCTASRVRHLKETEYGLEMLADLLVAYKFLREKYSSAVVLTHEPLTITVNQAQGPFSHLYNRWDFKDTDTGSVINFELQFNFSVPLLRRVIAPLMGRAVSKFVDAFEARAHEIYAPSDN